jgi:hypothetical protein
MEQLHPTITNLEEVISKGSNVRSRQQIKIKQHGISLCPFPLVGSALTGRADGWRCCIIFYPRVICFFSCPRLWFFISGDILGWNEYFIAHLT